MQKKKLNSRAFDALVLLILFAASVLGVLGVRALLYGQKEDEPPARIVIRIEGVDASLADGLHEGERVIDRTNRRLLGTVSEIRRTPALTEIAPAQGSEAVSVEREDLVNIDLALTPDHDHGGYFVTPRVWSVGKSLTFATPSFAAVGTIIRIER